MTLLLTITLATAFATSAPSIDSRVAAADAWSERMLALAISGKDAGEPSSHSAARYTFYSSQPLATFPRIVLREVASIRTDAEAAELDRLDMEPVMVLAHRRAPKLVERILDLLEMLDAETHELLRTEHKLVGAHFYVHPLTLRFLRWLPEAAARPMSRPDVFNAQAAGLLTELLSERSHIVLKGTYWAAVDAAVKLQDAIMARYDGPPGLGDHSTDRDDLQRYLGGLQLAIQRELLRQAQPIFENERLCGLRLEAKDETAP